MKKSKPTIKGKTKPKKKVLPKSRAKGKPYAAPDPFEGLEPTGDIETDSATELNAMQSGFQKRAKDEADRYLLATDSEFWFAVCFESRDQKEMFLRAMEWMQLGDKYLDGTELARIESIELPKVRLANKNAVRRKDKKLADLM
jgi:hypothetical protein